MLIDSASVSAFGSASVRASDSASVRAFGSALRRPEEREAYSATRDLHTMRLLARAYEASA